MAGRSWPLEAKGRAMPDYDAKAIAAKFTPGTSPQHVRRRIEGLERLLERSFTLPIVNRPVGLDAIAGLVPVAGDMLTAAMGLYLVWEARNLGMSRWKQLRMIGRVGLDTAIGAIPVAGDLFDFLYRSNSANVRKIRRHLDRHHPETRVAKG